MGQPLPMDSQIESVRSIDRWIYDTLIPNDCKKWRRISTWQFWGLLLPADPDNNRLSYNWLFHNFLLCKDLTKVTGVFSNIPRYLPHKYISFTCLRTQRAFSFYFHLMEDDADGKRLQRIVFAMKGLSTPCLILAPNFLRHSILLLSLLWTEETKAG